MLTSRFILLATLLFGIWIIGLEGCDTVQEVQRATVRDIVLTKQPPPVHETLPATVSDSLIFAFRTEGIDTVLDVRYYPLQRRFIVKLKPDQVFIVGHDTLTNSAEHPGAILETAVRSKVGLLLVGILAALAAFLLNL